MPEVISALSLAEGVEQLYAQFTDSIRSMGKKHGGKRGASKLASSALHWLAGSHIRTERDVLCDKFMEDVRSHLEMFDYALEGEDAESARKACFVVARTMTEPLPADSNSTSVLMKRAMVQMLRPYLVRLSDEELLQIEERIKTAYPKNKRLPVENDILKDIAKLRSATDSPSAK